MAVDLSAFLRDPAATRLLQLELGRRKMLNFVTWTKPTYEVNWHHKVLCHYLDMFACGQIPRMMVFWPPRHGKSELVSRRLPAYILGKYPAARIIASSYNADLAQNMSRDVQGIMEGDAYRELFPLSALPAKGRRVPGYVRTSDEFAVPYQGGGYRAAGVGGGITGLGMNYGIIDDPHKDRAEAESKTIREGVHAWYASTFYTRKEPAPWFPNGGDGSILLTNTRWHEDDLAGHLLTIAKQDPAADQWFVLNFPALLDDLKQRDPADVRQVMEALWPSKFPLAVLLRTKAVVGSYEWASIFQQQPSPAEGGVVKRSWWQRYDRAPSTFDVVIQSWDMAFKDKKTSDYVVGQVWGKKAANKYLLDQFRARVDFTEACEAVKDMSRKWPQARAKLVEDKANGTAIINHLKKIVPGLIAWPPEGERMDSKIARARAIAPDIQAGNVWLPNDAPWVKDYIEEWAAFPNGTHDDQVDATSQALERLGSKLQPAVTTLEDLRRAAAAEADEDPAFAAAVNASLNGMIY